MKPSALMAALKARLEAWMASDPPDPADPADRSARPILSVELAKDIQHALGKLVESTKKQIVVLCWNGEDALGEEFDPGNLARQEVLVLVGWNPGLSSKRDENALPMLDVVRDIKNVCLGLPVDQDGTNGPALASTGINPVTLPDGYPLAAFSCRLRLDDDGGEIVTETEPVEE